MASTSWSSRSATLLLEDEVDHPIDLILRQRAGEPGHPPQPPLDRLDEELTRTLERRRIGTDEGRTEPAEQIVCVAAGAHGGVDAWSGCIVLDARPAGGHKERRDEKQSGDGSHSASI